MLFKKKCLQVEADRQACSARKIVKQRQQQTARRDSRKALLQGREPDAQTAATAAGSSSYLVAGPGDPAASRYRITYCARQTVDNYFDSTAKPTGQLIN